MTRTPPRFAVAFAALVLLTSGRFCLAADTSTTPADRSLGPNVPAYRALQEGRVAEAATLLNTTLATHAEDATAHQLLCRVFYAQDKAERAIHECELAVAKAPANSDHYLWLGRAYSMKAQHAGPLSGFSLARKVRDAFARAVELNSSNLAALSDLGEYYVFAPSIVGGGNDKAQALAARMMPNFPAAAHRAPDLAERALRDYLASPARSDAAPAFKVHLQLARLLAARGAAAAAHTETAAAADLAPACLRNRRSGQKA